MYGYVYKTTNLINNKIYIGVHKKQFFDKYYLGSGKMLRRAIRKYGRKNFKCEVLEWCSNKATLFSREQYWVAFYNSKDPAVGYNIVDGGGGIPGFVHTDEEKERTQQVRNRNGKLHWYNNGKIELQFGQEEEIPAGFIKGRLKQTIAKVAQSKTGQKIKRKVPYMVKGRHWFTNGNIDVFVFTCPEGFEPGRSNLDVAGEKNPMFGKVGANLGKHLSSETKSKISHKNKGKKPWNKNKHYSLRKRTAEERDRISIKNGLAILMLDKDTKQLVKEFPSLQKAALFLRQFTEYSTANQSTLGKYVKKQKEKENKLLYGHYWVLKKDCQ